ncbi:LapA family protein [Paenibacillus soyae]|uniref:Lipopolysaccharide assembly protein LapA domain-containing protein n=1 Tax=Paenibacillus soyae TaxID=2969249 RepID=A0A9X2MML9_9BACL|nr:lipopolysaccharide assembly protein LapA domain-containing protein [Paenibacillus soyae]MCR2803471.1 lipopolysaccharide assembly protein LapA domain-containing protein [Paenibacillus soyae]
MKGQGMLISAFAFALVIAVFAVINVEQVQVNFLFAKTTTPLILVILVSTLLGGLTVGLFGMLRIFRLQRTVKSLEKRIAELTPSEEGFEASYQSDPLKRAFAGAPVDKKEEDDGDE